MFVKFQPLGKHHRFSHFVKSSYLKASTIFTQFKVIYRNPAGGYTLQLPQEILKFPIISEHILFLNFWLICSVITVIITDGYNRY